MKTACAVFSLPWSLKCKFRKKGMTVPEERHASPLQTAQDVRLLFMFMYLRQIIEKQLRACVSAGLT